MRSKCQSVLTRRYGFVPLLTAGALSVDRLLGSLSEVNTPLVVLLAIPAGKPQRMLETAAETGRAEDEGWRVRKDGSQVLAHVVITALRTADGMPKDSPR